MREIKFRAWDKERKEMRQIQLMDWSGWWVSTGHTWERDKGLEYGERNSFKNEETDRHILMQYTGLHDKNGKEIYEGDIVVSFKKQYEDFPTTNKVLHANGCWKLVAGSMSDVPLYNYNDSELEVIGNIYENSDLLPKAIDATE